MYAHPVGRPFAAKALVAGALLLVVGVAETGLVVGIPSMTGVEETWAVVPGVVEVDLIVGEGVTEAAIFVLEGTTVEDDDFEELVLTGTAPVPGA